MNNITFKRNLVLAIMLNIFLVSIAPIISGNIEVNSVLFNNNSENIQMKNLPKWRQLIGDENAGFGKGTNHAIRGLETYRDELYVGIQSLNKSKLLDNIDFRNSKNCNIFLYDGLSEYLSYLIKNNLFFPSNSNNLLMPWLDISLNLGMHMRAKMSDGCEIWKYNYSIDTWFQLVGNHPKAILPIGFGDAKNIAASVIKEFKGKLYVGTWSSPLKGCEIWRYDGSVWEQVVGKDALIKGGFNDSKNIAAWCIEEFDNYLYVGTMNWDYSNKGGCQIWRTYDGIHWNNVLDRGFRDFLPADEQNVHNTYAWCAEVFQDRIYVGTFNTNSVFRFNNAGCQLWRSTNGENWEKVECIGGDGFGEKENYGIRCMSVYNNELYIATATDAYQLNVPTVQSFEIFKYDGVNWTEVIGEGGINKDEKDGFGSKWNKYVWSMTVSSDNKLWVGTLNMQIRALGENTKGCEIWCFDGESWIPIVKDHIGEIDNGFGCIYNEGARGIIEFPIGSGNIIVGTFKLMKPFKAVEGCEMWMRNV